MSSTKISTFPEPEPGRVISYAYVWTREAAAGRQEGRKTRPAAIVLASRKEGDNEPRVAVAPVTHSPPRDPSTAMEIPSRIQRHLGLDDTQKSWIVLDEINVFRWPGFDLQPIGRTNKYDYGILPQKFFAVMIKRMMEIQLQGLLKSTSRDESIQNSTVDTLKRGVQERVDARYEALKAKQAKQAAQTTGMKGLRTLKR